MTESSKENILAKLKKNLDILKKREAQTAGFAPLALLSQIEDYEEAVALTNQVIQGEMDETTWLNKLHPLFQDLGISFVSSPSLSSNEGFQSLFRVEECLASLKQSYQQLSRPKRYTSDQAKLKVINLLDRIQVQISDFEKQWHHLNNQASPDPERIQALYQKISEAREILSVLDLRGIHQQNLDLLEKYLAEARTKFSGLALQKLIEPKIKQEQDNIRFIERQKVVSATEQSRLEIHRQNVEFYQQMLRDELPYVPLQTLHQFEKEKQVLKELDAKIAFIIVAPQKFA